jgi:hypothetical protein
MNRTFLLIALACMATCTLSTPLRATQHIWYVTSPDHGQTYAYGSEVSRQWAVRGARQHLTLLTTYDNEPWAMGGNIRRDDFVFNFPNVVLGPDGETFFYKTSKGLSLVVAAKRHGFLGISEIKLLPTAFLAVKKVHGYLTMTLIIGDRPLEEDPDTKIGFMH